MGGNFVVTTEVTRLLYNPCGLKINPVELKFNKLSEEGFTTLLP